MAAPPGPLKPIPKISMVIALAARGFVRAGFRAPVSSQTCPFTRPASENRHHAGRSRRARRHSNAKARPSVAVIPQTGGPLSKFRSRKLSSRFRPTITGSSRELAFGRPVLSPTTAEENFYRDLDRTAGECGPFGEPLPERHAGYQRVARHRFALLGPAIGVREAQAIQLSLTSRGEIGVREREVARLVAGAVVNSSV